MKNWFQSLRKTGFKVSFHIQLVPLRVGRYADGSARSKVANAVRDGRDAHQYDDKKDDTSH